MNGKRFTTVERSAILDEYLNGHPIAGIASRWGCSESYPALIARRCGLERRRPDFCRERRQRRVQAAEEVMIREAHRSGYPLSIIAAAMRRDRATVRRILKAAQAARPLTAHPDWLAAPAA